MMLYDSDRPSKSRQGVQPTSGRTGSFVPGPRWRAVCQADGRIVWSNGGVLPAVVRPPVNAERRSFTEAAYTPGHGLVDGRLETDQAGEAAGCGHPPRRYPACLGLLGPRNLDATADQPE